MVKLSEKSQLINMCIGLAEGGPRGWPTPLDRAGYDLGKLHPTFRNTSGQRVNPEILFRSHEGILVTNCETNGLSEDDIEKNSDVQMKNIRREFTDLNGVERHEIVYSGMGDLDHSFSDLDIPDPGLVFNQNSGTLSKRNEFEDDTLNELIHSSSIPRQIPTRFYPFSPEDSLALIAQNLLRHLMSESVSREKSENRTDGGEIDSKEIASEIHDYWPLLSKEGQSHIVGKVDHILEKFNEKSMDDDMRKLENSGRSYYVRTSQSFRRKCNEVLDELEEEESQETLDRWTNGN